jgi:hypothetical protein
MGSIAGVDDGEWLPFPDDGSSSPDGWVFVSVLVSFVVLRRGSGTAAVGLVEHVADADDRG